MAHSEHGHAQPAELRIPDGHVFAKLPMVFLLAGIVSLVGGWVTAHDAQGRAFSYLVGYLFALTLALGPLFFVIVQHAARAGWSVVVRRIAENLASVLPLFALLFIPIWLGRHELYHHWLDAEAVAADPVLKAKEPYLNEGFWAIRALVFFVVWAGLSFFFRTLSVRQDASGDHAISAALRKWSYAAIPLFALSITFAAVDWVMSLDPHFFSTMWGVWFFAGSTLSGYALITLFALAMHKTGLLDKHFTVDHMHDLGKLVFAFTVFWAYISFSQFFLIWYANLPEETIYFAHRMGNSWEKVGIFLMAGHFGVPFLYMLSRNQKRKPGLLVLACLWILFVHWIDIYYAVQPNNPAMHHGVHFSASDVLMTLGLSGLSLGVSMLLARRANVLPVRDPRLSESLAFQNF
jgi:hypothetical protein